MLRGIILMVLLSYQTPFPLWATDNYLMGGRAAGMGNASVTLYDLWAVTHNQAGMAHINHISVGAGFENRFLVRELSVGAAAVAYPVSSGVFGLSLTHMGFELYNQSKVGIAFARKFSDMISAGIQLNYHNTFLAYEYGNKANFTVEMGIITHILPNMSLGVHVFNPTRAKIAEFADERIPTIFRTGISYTFSENVLVTLETEKDINQKAILKSGIEYHISDPIYLRAGIGTRPSTNSFGFGIAMGSLSLDLATSFHYILGYSPQISMMYVFD